MNYMIRIKKKNLFWEYFFMFSIIALTGFEFFFRNSSLIYLLLGPLSLFIFIQRKLKFTNRITYFLLVLTILTFLQSIFFKIAFGVVITTIIRFFIYFLIASILIKDFAKVYVNIIFFIGVISLFFYALINISSSAYGFLISVSNNIIPLGFSSETEILSSNPNNTLLLFTIPHELIYRNSGPFWEPGMFGVFLSIAFSLNMLKYGFKSKKNIIFILAGASTLSTTTFIAFFIIIGIHLYFKKENSYTLIGFGILLLLMIQVYNLPFINDKINSDIDNSDKAYSRFGAMIVHYNQILDSPLIGYGTYIDKDQELRLGLIEVTPNGLSNVIRFFGIPFSILYYYLLYNSARILAASIIPKKNKYGILLFIVFLLVSFSQDITTRHFYFVLITIPLVLKTSIESTGYFLLKNKKYKLKILNR